MIFIEIQLHVRIVRDDRCETDAGRAMRGVQHPDNIVRTWRNGYMVEDECGEEGRTRTRKRGALTPHTAGWAGVTTPVGYETNDR